MSLDIQPHDPRHDQELTDMSKAALTDAVENGAGHAVDHDEVLRNHDSRDRGAATRFYLVDQTSGMVAAVVSVSSPECELSGRAYLYQLGTNQSHRNRGLSSALLKATGHLAYQAGIDRIGFNTLGTIAKDGESQQEGTLLRPESVRMPFAALGRYVVFNRTQDRQIAGHNLKQHYYDAELCDAEPEIPEGYSLYMAPGTLHFPHTPERVEGILKRRLAGNAEVRGMCFDTQCQINDGKDGTYQVSFANSRASQGRGLSFQSSENIALFGTPGELLPMLQRAFGRHSWTMNHDLVRTVGNGSERLRGPCLDTALEFMDTEAEAQRRLELLEELSPCTVESDALGENVKIAKDAPQGGYTYRHTLPEGHGERLMVVDKQGFVSAMQLSFNGGSVHSEFGRIHQVNGWLESLKKTR